MIFNLTSKKYVARKPRFAKGFIARLRGLIGLRAFPECYDALVFRDCTSIHTCFMTMAIDIIMLDGGSKIVHIVEDARPWRMMIRGDGAKTVIELPPGAIRDSQSALGDLVNIEYTADPEQIKMTKIKYGNRVPKTVLSMKKQP